MQSFRDWPVSPFLVRDEPARHASDVVVAPADAPLPQLAEVRVIDVGKLVTTVAPLPSGRIVVGTRAGLFAWDVNAPACLLKHEVPGVMHAAPTPSGILVFAVEGVWRGDAEAEDGLARLACPPVSRDDMPLGFVPLGDDLVAFERAGFDTLSLRPPFTRCCVRRTHISCLCALDNKRVGFVSFKNHEVSALDVVVATTGVVERKFYSPGPVSVVSALPSGRVAFRLDGGDLGVWDTRRSGDECRFFGRHADAFAVFEPRAGTLVSVGCSAVRAWEERTGRLVAQAMFGPGADCTEAVALPNGGVACFSCTSRFVRVVSCMWAWERRSAAVAARWRGRR